jgi:hypothetical protein
LTAKRTSADVTERRSAHSSHAAELRDQVDELVIGTTAPVAMQQKWLKSRRSGTTKLRSARPEGWGSSVTCSMSVIISRLYVFL